MPAIQAPAKVLVSGANGYIAVWLVKTLLEKGYSVRGTVRSESKTAHLKKLFKKEIEDGKLELIVVADITAEGAFDEAVKGVDAIEHTASPFHFNIVDPKELIEPAVQGTVGILKSALAHGTNVKRVVITSSCASVLSVHKEPKVFSEADWNDQAIETVEKEGSSAPNPAKYRASKTLAEKAAWNFWKEHKDEVKWDVVALNPPFVFGPTIHEVSSADQLNTSAKQWYDAVIRPDSGGKSNAELTASGTAWVDVRDLALAHALALEKEEAGGERIIISAGNFSWQSFLDAANALGSSRTFNKGEPGKGTNEHLIAYDTSKEAKILGLKKRTIEEITKDLVEDFDKKGW